MTDETIAIDANDSSTQTTPPYDLEAATQALVAAYAQFLTLAKDMQIGDVFKGEGFRLIDSGWLWIEKGITEKLRAQHMAKVNAVPAPANDNTAPADETTPVAATQG